MCVRLQIREKGFLIKLDGRHKMNFHNFLPPLPVRLLSRKQKIKMEGNLLNIVRRLDKTCLLDLFTEQAIEESS